MEPPSSEAENTTVVDENMTDQSDDEKKAAAQSASGKLRPEDVFHPSRRATNSSLNHKLSLGPSPHPKTIGDFTTVELLHKASYKEYKKSEGPPEGETKNSTRIGSNVYGTTDNDVVLKENTLLTFPPI